MEFKGMDQLRKHFPDIQTSGGTIRVVLTYAGLFALVTLFFLWVDWGFYEWMPDGEIVVMAIGFLLMSRFFSQKKIYRQKYGELAYRNAFMRFWAVGLTIVIASYIHNGYMPGPEIPNVVWWKSVLVALGWASVIVGLALWARGVLAFGADSLALLYVYYPDEGRLVDSNIYSVVRHPAYAGLLRIGMGLGLIHGNWYSLIITILMPLGMLGLTRLVEEKELLGRFPSYADYRKRVPAFFPKPRDLVKFFRFLILGG
jgi:protein-S-isoprenylcysteine O-methyltransferase Ste14